MNQIGIKEIRPVSGVGRRREKEGGYEFRASDPVVSST